ncbi:MAG: sn-glycerol-3-phosphate ABC transporter ATP-binding protein UgpC [Bacilli bacterium]|nr:sn-glycerol-3-phosphate ABC transporter ATP-binding protein UgpC [Bacilli bacterium]
MASLKLSHIYKVYDNGHKAVNDFNIDIQDKEFIVFVGPSGCGKSTTLRMVAGLETITAGDLFIGDTLVNELEPKDRDIAMVFQNYALYPHMTVYENMAFGLRNRKMPEEEIRQKVLEAAKILDIEMYLDRKPKAMSGGQRQRVALGRALVRNPKVFLLDEPLSNLDAKLRAAMRTEITKLHKKLATTFIYVTHDQVEAMTMGTRIVVMKLGYVQQIDTPMNLYNKPYNKFVAGFIGSPQMNFFDVTLNRKGDLVEVEFKDGSKINLPYERVCKIHDSYLHGGVKVILGIRPEHISISEKATGLKCQVNTVEHLGNECIVYGEIGQSSEEFTMKDEGKNIIVKTIEGTPVNAGDTINLLLNEEKIHFFDSETEITLMSPIPAFSLFEAKKAGEKMDIFGSKVDIPDALNRVLEGVNNFALEIPPHAIVPGKDFTLSVKEVQEIEGKRLALLTVGDRYLFALVDDKVKAGSKYSFNLLNDQIRVLVEGKSVLEPIGDHEALLGTFAKRELKEHGERVLHFDYVIDGVAIEGPQANGYKINSVEGNACYKKQYRYGFLRSNIEVVEEGGIHANVVDTLDYGNVKFAVLDVNGQRILYEVAKDFDQKELQFLVKGENIEVYQIEIDMRIC